MAVSWRSLSSLACLAMVVLLVPVPSAEGAGLSTQGKGAAPEQVLRCGIRKNRHSTSEQVARCPRIPRKVVPWSLRTDTGSPFSLSGEESAARVAGETGNELNVTEARVTDPYVTPFVGNCPAKVPYRGGPYAPCAKVSFYDVGWNMYRAPDTNFVEDAEYDACGKLVTAGKVTGWRVTGTNYVNNAWIPGQNQRIPSEEPTECLGSWTLLYVWTQTFSNEETLSDSIMIPFQVTKDPLLGSASWGGGNPSELPCAQDCYGDPVSTATGDYYETTTDLAVRSRGPGLEMTRTYSSLAAAAGTASALGRGWSFAYDMSLSIDPETKDAVVTNPNGSQTSFEKLSWRYEAPPNVLAWLIDHEDGTYTYTIKKRTSYTFDTAGRLIGVSDRNGNKTTLAYDGAGILESAEDEAGRTITFDFDEGTGLLSGVADSAGREVSYDYTEAGDLETVTDVRGGETTYSYDGTGLLLSREDARGNPAVTNTYNVAGQVLTQTDALENRTIFAYTRSGASTFTKVTNARGYVAEYEYKANVLAKKTEAANTSYKATWTYKHDPETLGITQITDPTGKTSHAEYDVSGNQYMAENEIGDVTHAYHDEWNNLVEYVDGTGVSTEYTYDKHSNVRTVSTPLVGSAPLKSRTVTYTHGDEAHPGDVTAITDPRGKITHITYDAAGNMTSVVDPVGNKTTYTYDGLGRRLTEVRPSGNAEGAEPVDHATTFTYDAAGNQLSATDPLGNKSEWTYDPNGNLITATDGNGHTTTYDYDAANRLISVEQSDGQSRQTTYDANGNITGQIDGMGNETTYTYTPLDELKTTTDPLERTTSYRYYEDSKLRLLLDPQGRATFFGYNAADELTEVDYEGEAMADLAFEYDKDGRRTSMTDGTGESSYEYDSLGRLTEVVNGRGDVTTYGYDLAGNVTSIGYPNGQTVDRGFDDASRLDTVSDWLGNTTSFSYDPDSNLEGKAFPEGTGLIDEYEYDRADRLTSVEVNQGAESLASIGYSRNSVGQVTSLTAKGLPGAESEAFEYDENDRLIEAGEETFAFDDANNLIEAQGAGNIFDAANQLREGAGASYRYDASGRRTEAGPVVAGYATAFGTPGTEAGQLDHPAGIAADAQGDLWVVDQENRRVQEFSPAGEYLGSLGTSGTGNGEFERPTDVAIDGSGHIWVTDAGNNRVEEFNQTGEYLSQFGSEGEEAGQFSEPESLAVDSEGDIWVADTYNARLQEFDPEGKFIQAVGEPGVEEGQVSEATAVAVDPEDDIWLVDYSNARVSEFDQEGNFVQQFGEWGAGNTQFEGPAALDIDSEGGVWVADELAAKVKKFTQTGEYVGEFGSQGSGKGEFSFHWPLGILADAKGNVWVADSENDRVQKWKAAAAAGPKTSYAYDEAGRLIGVERAAGPESPAVDETYTYDGNGLRASQTVSAATQYLAWDQGSVPLLLSDGDRSYLYGPGGLPIEHISEGEATYYHQDQLGSTRMLTDSSGEVTGTFSYTAFGSLANSTGTETTPLGYAGQLTNVPSGLQYLRARVFDPRTGQFLSRDPMADVTGEAYSYAGNNPINGYDPSGLCNMNPFSGSFWTEGNCISESSFNPIPYYEREIEAWEAGCSYWESIQYGLKGAAVLAADSVGLYGLARAAAGGAAEAGVDIVFGHGSRHLAGTGLAAADVEAAIQGEVAGQVASASATGSFWGRVVVDGQTILYKAFTLPDGSVNVGTYYVSP